MANQVLSFKDLKGTIDLYNALPSATLFRGLTGYGLVLNDDGQEIIAEVSSAKAIWKPMYLVISGGKKHGREKLSESMIQLCLEEFQKNSLWAVLKSTSGYGLKLDGSGMVELAEAQQATTPITFEISHFGGRSILPMLSVSLGKVVSQEIEWKGGFSYQNEHNRPAKAGDLLVLNRFLSDDLEVKRIIADVVKEAGRLSLMNTDGNLPRVHDGGAPMMQIFLRQELTALIPGTQLERQAGFDYSVRQDGIEVQMRLLPYQTSSAEIFETAFTAFRKECARVQMLYCQPLTENQRQKAGKPSNEVFGVSDVQWLNWQPASRGDGVIAFHPRAQRRHDAVFSTEGWFPKEGDRHRVLCLRKGNGFAGFPAPPAYVSRYVQKDDLTASLQIVLINFDGREKVVSEKDVPLSEKWEWEDGKYYSARAEMTDGIWIVEQIRGTWQLRKERVNETGRDDINGKPITAISAPISNITFCPAERRFRPEQIFIEPFSYFEGQFITETDPASKVPNGWKIITKGKNPDGKEVTAHVNKQGASDVPYSWEEIPEAIRQQHLEKWPVCSCGRQRYEKAKYDRCELCRDYRPCASCGTESKFGEGEIAEAARNGKALYCRKCRNAWANKWEPADEAITPEFRQKIVAEANFLLSGKIVEGEVALNMLRENRLSCPPYAVVLVGNEYWATPFSSDLTRISTLLQQPPKEFLGTMETLTSGNPDFWTEVGCIVSKCIDNKPVLGQVAGEFVEEVKEDVELEPEPEFKPEPEPVEVAPTTSDMDLTRLAEKWGARIRR